MTGMIYQPQQRDMQLSDAFWPAAFSDLRKRGYDTLIVQWTQFGDMFSGGVEKKWLRERLQDAVTADLKLVIGLYADPDSFSALEMPTDLLEAYFLKNTEKNIHLAKELISTLPEKSIVGWYLPMEIDDRRWRAKSDQVFLAEQLSRDVSTFKLLSPIPTYITSFFKGNSEVNEYKNMLEEIKKISDLRIWIQDGVGGKALMPAETALYLKSFSACHDTPISGLVFEIFNQIGPDSNFKAEPLAANIKEKALQQRAPCGGDSVFFSLRYLINFRH
jgi:hypothetical protein